MDIQQAVRSLLTLCMKSLPKEQKEKDLLYWKTNCIINSKILVPAAVTKSRGKVGKLQLRASIILGIVCYLNPTIFTTAETKAVAESLEFVLKEDTQGIYCVTAIELIRIRIFGMATPLERQRINSYDCKLRRVSRSFELGLG